MSSQDPKHKKLRTELDSLMQNFNETFDMGSGGNTPSNVIGQRIDEVGQPVKLMDVDFDELELEFKAKAKSLIDSMFAFYLDEGIIDRVKYSKFMQDIDATNVSNMLWQLKTVKITLRILMEEVITGNTNPKTIAAINDMQERFSEVMRMQSNYLLFLEDKYKKLKFEEIENTTNPDAALAGARKEIADKSEYFLSANPKEVVRQITEVNPMTDDELAGLQAEENYDVTGTMNTDPMRKEELMREKNINIEEKKNDDASGYSSILDMI